MHNYFCGWYYRCQSEQQTLAVIPSVHRTRESKFCTIQMITDKEPRPVSFAVDSILFFVFQIANCKA